MKRLLSILICLVLIFPMFSIDVNAGKARVVYLKTGGKGDGSSYSKAVGTLADAYNALDLSKDCTVVICGDFTQPGHFTYGKPYTGSVTFTSVYGGVDYKEKYGAEYISPQQRFVAYGETIFDNIDLRVTGNYFFIIANCNPITLTENFNPVYLKKVSGDAIDSGVSILAGYQNGQDMFPLEAYNDINVKVMGGKNICIVAYNRAVKHGYHFGTANITVGGKAQVGTLRFGSIDAENIICGNVNITVKDSAKVNYIRSGNKNNIDVNSVIVNWEGGSIGEFIPSENIKINGTDVLNTVITEGAHLRYSESVKNSSSFKKVSDAFDYSVLIGSPDDNFVPTEAEPPADISGGDIAPATTAYENTDEADETTAEITWATHADFGDVHEEDDKTASLKNALIIGGSGLVCVCAIVIILLLRKK